MTHRVPGLKFKGSTTVTGTPCTLNSTKHRSTQFFCKEQFLFLFSSARAVRPHCAAERPHCAAERPHCAAEWPHCAAERPHCAAERPHSAAVRPRKLAFAKHVSNKFANVFTSFFSFWDLLGSAWTCSDALKCAQNLMHLDAFGCTRFGQLVEKLVFCNWQ